MIVKTTLREALSDSRLLGKALPGTSWLPWRALLLAAMGEPLSDEELEIFRAVTGRANPPSERVEELIAIVGRRGGKSRAVAVLACYLSTLIDYSGVLVPGEVGTMLCIAPDTKQAGVVQNYCVGVLEQSPVLRPTLLSRTQTTLRLANEIEIDVRGASWRRLRGVTAIGAVCDEAAFWYSDEISSNPDAEILNAIRPALATTGGMCCILTTPYSKRGETWRLFSEHYGAEGDPILVANGSSRDFNPSLPQRVIDRAYERDPAAASAEYGGQFRNDIASFIAREVVTACVETGTYERPPKPGVRYKGFVDPSGGSSDSMTFAIAHKDGERVLIDCVREVRPPFDPESTVIEFCGVLKSYGLKSTIGDRYGASWVSSAFAKHGVEYRASEFNTSQIYQNALPLLNAKRLVLLDHKKLVDQLAGLERRSGFTGRDAIGHAPGAHDDVANAVCGAAILAERATLGRMRVTTTRAGSATGLAGGVSRTLFGERIKPLHERRWRWQATDIDGNPSDEGGR